DGRDAHGGAEREGDELPRQRGGGDAVGELGGERRGAGIDAARRGHGERRRFQADLEAQDGANLVAGPWLRERVDRVGVDPLDRDRERRAVGREVQGRVVEGVRRVEVEGGGAGACGWVPFAPDVLQAGEYRVKANRIDAVCDLRVRQVVRKRLDVGEAVVGDRVRAGGADRAGDDRERPGDA